MTLLLAEDDPELARQVLTYLETAGHEVEWRAGGIEALDLARKQKFDVLLLDVNLPGCDGFSLVESLRKDKDMVPVLFLTARGAVADRVRGLSAGGDDYLTKPFAMEELLARLEALYRRALHGSANAAASGTKMIGDWVLDTRQRRLKNAREVIDLQPRECALLDLFIDHEGRMLTKKFLLDKVWDIRFDPGTNVVDAMICRLRRKIDAPGQASYIQTKRGQGYVFTSTP